ncbi:MAG: hypothetical protein QXE92_03465 [Thermofilaceae archaeon]
MDGEMIYLGKRDVKKVVRFYDDVNDSPKNVLECFKLLSGGL